MALDILKKKMCENVATFNGYNEFIEEEYYITISDKNITVFCPLNIDWTAPCLTDTNIC